MDLTTGQRAKERTAKSVFSIRSIVELEEDTQTNRNGESINKFKLISRKSNFRFNYFSQVKLIILN